MLVLTRKVGRDTTVIIPPTLMPQGRTITIKILSVERDRVSVGFVMDDDVRVLREEARSDVPRG